ncbi:MAG: tetratricopeptide repeat protein [Cellvibrionaceae bacterium]|nr:tetratricopeptide repeat protein [Cellvibrionaceae bacterium]
MFAYIYDDLAQLPAQQQNEWYSALAEVWRYHLPIGEDYDLAYDLALLAAELNRWQSAIYLFLQSLQRANETQNQSAAYFNLGIAHWQIAAYSKAESYLVKALALAENEEKLAAENAEQTDVIAEPAANTIAGENSEEQNSIVGEQDIAAQDDDGDEDLDDDDDDDGDDDLDDDNEEHEEQNPAESQTLTISAQLTELRTWQARCQTILGAETLRLPATSPANPKALYASLLGPHQALALYRLQWDPELAALAGVECLRSTEHRARGLGRNNPSKNMCSPFCTRSSV